MPKTPGEKKSFKAGIVKGMTLVDEGLPGWFGTFADMMTLLFAFFVLLAAPVSYTHLTLPTKA